jgi:ubiquinone/menaquinone biosynthesis C-methylase UbiE
MTQIHQNKASEREYYDQLFSSRKRFDQFENDGVYEVVAAAARQAVAGGTALDLGCGSGTQAICLTKEGSGVISADLSPEATKLCRANTAGAERILGVVNADAEWLPFRDASDDACICSLFLHHFRSLLKLSEAVRPPLSRGNGLLTTFRRTADLEPSRSGQRVL